MLTKMTIMTPGANAVEASVDMPERPDNSDLREALGPLLNCLCPEHVSVLYRGRPADMFVDEDGVEKRLALNPEATAHYRRYTLTQEPETDPESLPAIYGPAILFDRRVWF